MLKTTLMALTALTLVAGSAEAKSVKIISGSKYPIIVEVYEGTSKNSGCKANPNIADKLDGTWKGIKKAGASVRKAMSTEVNKLMVGDGCTNVGEHELKGMDDSIPVAEGQIVVAFKDMTTRWTNPLPTIFKVPESGKDKGKDVLVNTCKVNLGVCSVDFGLEHHFE